MNHDYFYNIPGLMIPKFANLGVLNIAINKFIDIVPPLTESLNKNLTDKYVGGLVKDLEQIVPLLGDVYSRSLETSGNSMLGALRGRRMIPRGLKAFITSLNTLSIDMQAALRRAEGNTDDSDSVINEVEKHVDAVNNLSTVLELLDSGEYEEAEALITELIGFNKDVNFAELMLLVRVKQYKDAAAVVKTLIEKEKKAMEESAGVDLSKKILAVDDKSEILSFVSEALKNHYKVFGAISGNVASQIIETQKIDLFILDIDMPVMDGYELAKTIRGIADYEKTPILFLTSNTSREHVKKALEAGGNYMIAKPACYETLLSKVSKFLD